MQKKLYLKIVISCFVWDIAQLKSINKLSRISWHKTEREARANLSFNSNRISATKRWLPWFYFFLRLTSSDFFSSTSAFCTAPYIHCKMDWNSSEIFTIGSLRSFFLFHPKTPISTSWRWYGMASARERKKDCLLLSLGEKNSKLSAETTKHKAQPKCFHYYTNKISCRHRRCWRWTRKIFHSYRFSSIVIPCWDTRSWLL
jgi:hypothetical protein